MTLTEAREIFGKQAIVDPDIQAGITRDPDEWDDIEGEEVGEW